jgi:hypothetical protein
MPDRLSSPHPAHELTRDHAVGVSAPGTRVAAVDGPEVRELAAALRTADPMRAPFDAAVRRFVRVERERGLDLDTILATLAAVLRVHVEPGLATSHREALRDAVAWFAVSEFHRAD